MITDNTQPIDVLLGKKPEPVVYKELIESYQQKQASSDDAVSLHHLLEDKRVVHTSMDRNVILQRLKTNGFLVSPCIEDRAAVTTTSSSSPSEETVDEIKPKAAPDFAVTSDDEDDEQKNADALHGRKIPKKITIGKTNPPKAVEENVDESAEQEPEPDSSTVDLPEANHYREVQEEPLHLDSDTIFVVCNSKDTQKPPGKEPGEKINSSKKTKAFYDALAKIGNWRTVLCNDSMHSFQLDNITWSTVDHYYIASQYKNQSFFSDLAQNYEIAKEVEKTKKYSSKKVSVDSNFSQRNKREMYLALYAKFTQHPELARILHATQNATLMYRISPKKKTEFTELMWLRHSLRKYTEQVWKPLVEEPTAAAAVAAAVPRKKKSEHEESTESLEKVALGEYELQLPVYKPDVVRVSSYYLNNRVQFVQSINQLFQHIRKNNPSDKTVGRNSFDLLEHQRIVLNYLQGDRPYHGLLVYHNLGTGKSCTSIAVAEGMKHDKEIIILLPASLKTNYWAELQKCGDMIYKQNQHWEFVSTDGRPDLVPVLAKALNLNTVDIRKNKGAYMVDARKEPNFANLSPTVQSAIQEQLQEMINQKYKNIHYNANNLGSKVDELRRNKKNPFDHTVVILEEAHNFISRIVGNLRKKKTAETSVYIRIYELMLQATDFRIVMLSGTPILNYPQEMGVMFNLLRGGILTWTFDINTKESMSTEKVESMLKKERLLTYDYLQYQYGKITITKNPFGFVNVDQRRAPTTGAATANTKKKRPAVKSHKTTQKQRPSNDDNTNTDSTVANQSGGAGKYGVRLDSRGNVDNKQFEKKVQAILEKNNIQVKSTKSKIEKCLPDDGKFIETFIKETSSSSSTENDDQTDLMNINTLRRRILGLTSYYRTSNTDVLPRIIMTDSNSPVHQVRVPMSDHQIEYYLKVRSDERIQEKNEKKRKRMVNNNDLYEESSSSYRVFSRCACNFTFPNDIKRPIPKGKNKEVHEHTIEANTATPVMMAEYQDEDANNQDDFYQKEIVYTMKKIAETRDTLLKGDSLKKYSPKMWTILQNLQDKRYKGLHLLYSAFRTLEGIGLFKEVLMANGYQEFKLTKKDGTWHLADDFKLDGRPCFVLYTGTEEVETREIIRNIYNGDWNPPNVPESISVQLREISSNNLYGEIIQLFMITAAGAEGINLKNTRYVHMMEPYWNMVRLEQVMGRARRIKSHIDLPKEEQTVQTFLYLSVLSDSQIKNGQYKEITENDLSKITETPITTDEYLYELSQLKQKINKQLLTVMKETAMDCHVHIQEHKKNEKLVCYGPQSGDKEFVDYPALDKVLEEDPN